MTTEPITILQCGGTEQANTSTPIELRSHPGGYVLVMNLLAWWIINQPRWRGTSFSYVFPCDNRTRKYLKLPQAFLARLSRNVFVRRSLTIPLFGLYPLVVTSLPDDYNRRYTLASSHFPTSKYSVRHSSGDKCMFILGTCSRVANRPPNEYSGHLVSQYSSTDEYNYLVHVLNLQHTNTIQILVILAVRRVKPLPYCVESRFGRQHEVYARGQIDTYATAPLKEVNAMSRVSEVSKIRRGQSENRSLKGCERQVETPMR